MRGYSYADRSDFAWSAMHRSARTRRLLIDRTVASVLIALEMNARKTLTYSRDQLVEQLTITLPADLQDLPEATQRRLIAVALTESLFPARLLGR